MTSQLKRIKKTYGLDSGDFQIRFRSPESRPFESIVIVLYCHLYDSHKFNELLLMYDLTETEHLNSVHGHMNSVLLPDN